MATHHTPSYRLDIQGLRAIAIVLVVLAHAEISVFSGGFVGVDVFFVLSGYLITGLLIREYTPTKRLHLQFGLFIVRRLKRLLPALIVMMILVVLLAPLLITSYELREQTASAAYASTWTSNFYFALSALDYFSNLPTRDLFLHTWSLGVEEQFYIVWPVLILVVLAFPKQDLARISRHTRLNLILGALFISSLGLSLYWASTQPIWSFYLMPSRIWQFAMGAGVFVCLGSLERKSKSTFWLRLSSTWRNGIGVGGLFLILGSSVFMHPDMTYPGYWALLPSFGAVLIIAAGSNEADYGIGRLFSHPALVWIGDRSYSWYLWHWPVLILGFSWVGQHGLVEAMFLIVLSLMLAILSYRLVELPFWKGQLSHVPPARSVLISVAVMASVAVSTPKTWDLFNLYNEDQNTLAARVAHYDAPIIYSLGCDTWFSSAEVAPCITGGADASKTVVLFADSIGAHWYALLPEIFKTPTWRVVVLTKSSCAIVDEDFFYSRIGKKYTVCTQWRNAALDYLSSIKPDIIFVANAATYKFSKEQWVNGSTRVLARLTAAADHVIVVPGIPSLSFNGPSCLLKQAYFAKNNFVPKGPICREKLAKQSAIVAGYLEQAVNRFPNAKLLNLNNLVCPDGYCSAKTSADVVVFRDTQHLADSFVRTQAPNVKKKLEKLGLGPL